MGLETGPSVPAWDPIHYLFITPCTIELISPCLLSFTEILISLTYTNSQGMGDFSKVLKPRNIGQENTLPKIGQPWIQLFTVVGCSASSVEVSLCPIPVRQRAMTGSPKESWFPQQ